MKIEIKHRYSGSVLFSLETGSLRLAIEAAVKGGANLSGANLRGADLGDADLRDANLGGAYLGDADLRDADLRGANLRGANLGDADLRDADLRGADLGGANLGGADLGGANLGGADLGDADLRGANLRGANLGDADLGGGITAKDTPIQILGLQYDVLIFDAHAKIGCETHSLHDWAALDGDGAMGMDGESAARFHAEKLPAVLAMAKACGRSFDPVVQTPDENQKDS